MQPHRPNNWFRVVLFFCALIVPPALSAQPVTRQGVNRPRSGTPRQRRQKTLIRFKEFVLGGVPIGADRDPTPNEIPTAISVH
jgi:hypothetical protein